MGLGSGIQGSWDLDQSFKARWWQTFAISCPQLRQELHGYRWECDGCCSPRRGDMLLRIGTLHSWRSAAPCGSLVYKHGTPAECSAASGGDAAKIAIPSLRLEVHFRAAILAAGRAYCIGLRHEPIAFGLTCDSNGSQNFRDVVARFFG